VTHVSYSSELFQIDFDLKREGYGALAPGKSRYHRNTHNFVRSCALVALYRMAA
jgi:hypothetical protein